MLDGLSQAIEDHIQRTLFLILSVGLKEFGLADVCLMCFLVCNRFKIPLSENWFSRELNFYASTDQQFQGTSKRLAIDFLIFKVTFYLHFILLLKMRWIKDHLFQKIETSIVSLGSRIFDHLLENLWDWCLGLHWLFV